MNVFKVILVSLAVYRLGWMIAVDAGPLNVFENLRTWAGRRASSGNKACMSLAEGLNCHDCASVWMAFLLAPLAQPANLGEYILIVFASAGVALFLYRR